jgi:hypothetical protein
MIQSFKTFIIESKTKRVGKEIGGSSYFHKNYVENHPRIPDGEYEKALSVLKEKHPDHKFNIVRYGYSGPDKGSFSFIHSPYILFYNLHYHFDTSIHYRHYKFQTMNPLRLHYM